MPETASGRAEDAERAPAPEGEAPPRGRFARALGRLALTGARASVFAASAIGAAGLALDLPPTRRIATRITNRVLGSLFEGKIVVDGIDRLTLRGVRVSSAAAIDPTGNETIRVVDLRARADVLGIVQAALFGGNDKRLVIPLVTIASADVEVEQRGGDVTLARTFAMRHSPPSAATPAAPAGPSAKVEVALSRIEIAHAFVHGEVAPPRALDADVNRLVASLTAGTQGVVLDVEPTGLVERRLLPARTEGAANYHLRVDDKGARMWAGLVGQLGGVEVLATADLDGDVLRASADVPNIAPDVVTSLVPGVAPTEPLAARVQVEGPIPHLAFTAETGARSLSRGATRVSAEGKLDFAGDLRVEADVAAHDVDPHLFGEALPRASLGGDAHVRLELGELLRLAVDARTEASAIEGQPIPAAELHAVLDRGVVTGRFTADETGMPVEGSFTFAPSEGVRFDASTEIAAIHAAPRIAGAVDGRARVHVAGVLKDEELDARVDGTVASLRLPGEIVVDRAAVRGRVRGPLDALSIDASASGAGMRAGGYAFDRVTATAVGPVKSLRLGAKLDTDDGGHVEATGRLDPRAKAVRGIRLAIARDGTEVTGKLARVGADRGGVAVEGLELGGDGTGALHGSLRVANRDVTGTLKGEDVDLQQLGRLLGIPYRLKGVADVDVALERDKSGRKGHVMVALEDGEGPLVSGLSAMLTTTFEGDAVKANALVRLVSKSSPSTPADQRCDGTIAQVRLTNGDGTLRGPLLDPATWATLTGDAEVAAEDWNLRCLARLVPVGLPFAQLRGSLTTKLRVSRPEGQRFASVRDLSVRTSRLEIVGPDAPGTDEPAWASHDVDVQIRGDLDGATGRANGEVTLWDGALLGDVSTSVDLDLATLFDHPERRAASLRDSTLSGRLALPRRTFESLPPLLRDVLPPLTGEARVDAYVDGTIARPFVTLHAFGFQVAAAGPPSKTKGTGPSPWAMPVDAEAIVTYDSEQATLDARVSRRGRDVATITAGVEADLGALVTAAPGAKLPWTGGFEAKLDEVPLGDLPFFADRGIAGPASGTVRMTGLNAEPTLSVDVSLPDLQIGPDLFLDEAKLGLEVKRPPGAKRDTAIVKASVTGQGGGRLDASAYAGVTWKDGLVPVIDADSPADFFARATAFRAAAFQPFVSGVFSKLDGYLDGDLRFGFRRLGDGERGSVTAKMRLRDGVLNLPQLGQELRHAEVDITAEPTGEVRLDGIRAEGISGRIEGWAQARLDGLRFLDAGAQFIIPEGHELPLTVEGVPLGEARGELRVTAHREGEAIVMDVGVPSFHLALPSSSRRNAESLDDNPDVFVSHPLGPPKETSSDFGTKLVFNLDLGDVRIEGTGVELTLVSAKSGERPQVELTDKVRLRGEIDIAKGRISVLGKDFQIEQGLVRMRPETPSNPFVNVTARWDAPDGSPIYVDYVGDLQPITAEKLKFRANGRSQSDVLAMLLGEESGTDGRGTAASTRAIGAGGAYIADQLNAMLQGVAPGFSTGIAQTEDGALKTSVAYQIGDKVTARASYQQQTARTQATPGAAYGVCISDRPGAACTELSVEWRLDRHFSVRGAVGGVGDTTNSSLDLLWQYRY